jgi:hypothetical protein
MAKMSETVMLLSIEGMGAKVDEEMRETDFQPRHFINDF